MLLLCLQLRFLGFNRLLQYLDVIERAVVLLVELVVEGCDVG